MSAKRGQPSTGDAALNINEDELTNLAEQIRNASLHEVKNPQSFWNNPDILQKAGSGINRLVRDKYQSYIAELRENAPKILLVGDTGLGKSSLINIVFDFKLDTGEYAKVGDGDPCTQNFSMYGPEDTSPVRIIDSQGIEKLKVDQQFDELLEYIIRSAQSKDILDHIHLIYYFVGMNRWQEADKKYVEKLRQHCGLIIIINKSDIRKESEITSLRRVILRDFPDIHIAECGDPRNTYNWIPLSCKKGHGKNDLKIDMVHSSWTCEYVVSIDDSGPQYCGQHGNDQPFGHKELVRMSLELLPELVRPSFRSAQRVDLWLRHVRAAVAILSATSLAAGVGAFPVPFSDLPILLAIEGIMGASLMAVYGVPIESFNGKTLMAMNSSIVGMGGTIGYFTAQVLKAIPGFGTAMGASIDMFVAGSAVLVLGISMSVVLSNALGGGYLEDGARTMQEIVTVGKSMNVESMVRAIIGGNRDKEILKNSIADYIERTANDKTN